jgi:multiple sugar transport system permease protein
MEIPAAGATVAGRSTWLTIRHREALTGIVFVAPQLLGFLAFVGGPLIAILFFSFFDWNILFGTLEYIGLANYEQILNSREVANVARTTIIFGLGFVPVTVALGLLLALAVSASSRISILFRSAYFLPVVISLAAWTVVWRLMLQSDGPINGILQAFFGIDGPSWLRNPTLALWSAIVVQILKSAGYAMILFLAALQTVPVELREAARVDGATERQAFRSIVWPLIAPFTFMVTILLTIGSFKTFALIHLLTNGGPGQATTVMSFYVYEQGLQLFQMGYASAVAVVLFGAVMALTIGQFVLRRRWVDEDA